MSDSYHLNLELVPKSDISSREDLPNRNQYLTSSIISAKKVRGALLSSIRREICPHGDNTVCHRCEDRERCEFPNRIVPGFSTCSPALPRCSCSNPQCLPNAPSTYLSCKICSASPESSPVDQTKDFVTTGSLSTSSFCDRHKADYLRIQYSGPVCINCKSPLEKPSMNTKPGVRIDDSIGSAEHGGLFFVQTMISEKPFVTDITVEADIVDHIKELMSGGGLIQIGAGRSKGWGVVSINTTLEETASEFLDRRVPVIERVVEEYRRFALICRTGVATILESNQGFYSVPRVESVAGCSLERAKGRTGIFTGWSMRTGLQKPLIHAARPGSVFVYRVGNPESLDYEQIARTELLGVGQDILKRSQLNNVVLWEGV